MNIEKRKEIGAAAMNLFKQLEKKSLFAESATVGVLLDALLEDDQLCAVCAFRAATISFSASSPDDICGDVVSVARKTMKTEFMRLVSI